MNLRLAKSVLHRFATLALFGVVVLNAFGSTVEIVKSFQKSPVAEAEIVMSGTLETCHHHPEGCPKSCHCPKTHIPLQEVAETAGSATEGFASLNEPSWVTCNDEGTSTPTPFFALFIPEDSFTIPLLVSTGSTRSDSHPAPRDFAPAPPQKIPIV